MEESWGAGSWQCIFYSICQVADEILHGLENLGLSFGDWRVRFCQWCYRRDWHQDIRWSSPYMDGGLCYIKAGYHGTTEKICLGNGMWVDWDLLAKDFEDES